MRLSGIRKIAVLRANALGDYIFTLPALAALRHAYPEAEIVLLGRPWHAAFLAGRPGPVDRVIVVPRSKGVREEADARGAYDGPDVVERFFADMRAEHFDLAVQLHGGGRHSNPFVLNLGARHTIGLRTPDAAPLDHWIPYIYFQSEIMRCLEVVSLVGALPPSLEPRLAMTEQDRAESYAFVPAGSQPLVVLHPGAGDERRQWPPAKFAALADRLVGAGARVVVSGTEPERPITRAVLAGMQASAEDVTGRLSLGGLVGLLSRCHLVVSNDSGPLHVAEAVGAHTVGIYWCGNLINADPITRARHRPMLSWRLECPVCGRNCISDNCAHRSSFVADVPVAEVAEAALELLAAASRSPESAAARAG